MEKGKGEGKAKLTRLGLSRGVCLCFFLFSQERRVRYLVTENGSFPFVYYLVIMVGGVPAGGRFRFVSSLLVVFFPSPPLS